MSRESPMSDITYKQPFKTIVYKDGIAFGSIKVSGSGFKFHPHTGHGEKSEVFKTVEEVKAYIEETYP